MIAKGEFGAEVVDAALTTSQNTGTEQVAVQFRLFEGSDEGSTITEYLALTDAALPYSVEKLRACGWTGDDVSQLGMMAGTKVRLKIVHEEYQNKTRARVKFINAWRAWRELKKLGSDETHGIAERLRSKIAALDAAAGRAAGNGSTPAGGPPGPNPPPPSDEGIPF